MRESGLAGGEGSRRRAVARPISRRSSPRISRALSETIHSRYSTEPEHAAHTELDVTSPDFLVDHALWIARELVDRGVEHPARRRLRRLGADGRDRAAAASPLRRLARPGGVPGRGRRRLGRGPLAAVRPGFRQRGQRRRRQTAWSTTTRSGSAPARRRWSTASPSSAPCSATAPRSSWRRSAARQIAPHRIARDTALDVISGAAGAVLGLLAPVQGDARPRRPRPRDRVRRPPAPDRDGGDQGLSWRAPDGRVYTGFAHGVAGIAYALGRLFDVTGERRFGRASADGYRYVASRYVDTAQNWPVLGRARGGRRRPRPVDDRLVPRRARGDAGDSRSAAPTPSTPSCSTSSSRRSRPPPAPRRTWPITCAAATWGAANRCSRPAGA